MRRPPSTKKCAEACREPFRLLGRFVWRSVMSNCFGTSQKGLANKIWQSIGMISKVYIKDNQRLTSLSQIWFYSVTIYPGGTRDLWLLKPCWQQATVTTSTHLLPPLWLRNVWSQQTVATTGNEIPCLFKEMATKIKYPVNCFLNLKLSNGFMIENILQPKY